MNITVGQLDLTYRSLHQTAAEYTFFSSVHGTFSRTDPMLAHRTVNFKTEIIQSIFSNHSAIKLEINSGRKTEKSTDMWKLNNILLTNGSKKKSQEKLERI